MIITSIRIANAIGSPTDPDDYVDFVIGSNLGVNGYTLKGIQGFDPSPIIKFIEGFDNYSDPIYDMIPENKELMIKVGFNYGAAGTVNSLRSRLYKFMGRPVVVYLMNESTIVASITGYLDVDATHSTNQPDGTLVIKCDEGTFLSPTKINVPTAGLSKTTPTITYTEGDAATGFYMKITLTAGMSEFGLLGIAGPSDGFPRQWHIGFTFPFLSGDVLELTTWREERAMILTRGVVVVDLAPIVSSNSIWPKLHPGENVLTTYNANFDWTEFSYYARFMGV